MTNNTDTRIPVDQLESANFFTYAGRSGQIVSVHRPFLDDMTKPLTAWEVEYIETPDVDAPVLRVIIPKDAMVEVWD